MPILDILRPLLISMYVEAPMLRFGSRPLLRRWGILALPLFLVAVAGGCGGKGNVSGTVTVNGKPLPMGSIVFTPEHGPAVAAEIVDGKYSAVGVPAGDVKVSLNLSNLQLLADQAKPKTGVEAMAAKFGKGSEGAKKASMNPGANPHLPPEAKEQVAAQQKASEEANRRQKEALSLLKEIPQKYTDPNTSGWTVKVSVTGTTFDANVTK